jgi:SAM-dependent methyltransferase
MPDLRPALSDDERRRLAATFAYDTVAELFARARPGYAPEAIRWLLPATVHSALDLGAGTGLLSAQLVTRGLKVVAIDPSQAMLQQLCAQLPTVDARVGYAEDTGLGDGSVDAVVIGAALHWFERPAADREIARVLAAHGVVGVFGTEKDASVPWVVELNDLVDRRLAGVPRPPAATALPPLSATFFTEPERAVFPHTQTVDADLLADTLATRSYVIALSAGDRAELLDEVRHLALTHPDLAGRERFEIPYLTTVSRCYRRL